MNNELVGVVYSAIIKHPGVHSSYDPGLTPVHGTEEQKIVGGIWGHMIKMAAMPIYGENPFKMFFFFLRSQNNLVVCDVIL